MEHVTTNATAIEVSDLHKTYGDHEAVRGLTFDVRQGEVFGLLGPNGAGKTTTVEILEGYRGRTSGSVSVLGLDPGTRPRELRERVGIVLQSSALYSNLTVREAVTHFAGLYPNARGVDETISLVGLEGKDSSRSRTLSEPTTGFDPQARRAAWETIRALRELGTTIVLTTHYLDEAQALADRVAIIKDGVVVAEGTPHDIGGADAHRARISWIDRNGKPQELNTDRPTFEVNRLTGEALAAGHEIEALKVSRPSLEDVYLDLTAEGEGSSD